jgi:hypothetical protein
MGTLTVHGGSTPASAAVAASGANEPLSGIWVSGIAASAVMVADADDVDDEACASVETPPSVEGMGASVSSAVLSPPVSAVT